MSIMDAVKEALERDELHDQIANLAARLAAESSKNIADASFGKRIKDQEKEIRYIRESMMKSFDEYHVRMRNGVGLLGDIGLLKIDPKKFTALSSMIREGKGVGRGIQEELDLTNEALLGMYEYGANFFAAQEYASAADVFLVLTFLNAHIPSFWIGLGMAEEMKSDFQSAAFAFLVSAEISDDGLSWALKSAECFFKTGQRKIALDILDKVIEEAERDRGKAQILERAEMMKKNCL
jgi:tetratricopeptide (TPR) repeat protein